jgi:hypothetical protein
MIFLKMNVTIYLWNYIAKEDFTMINQLNLTNYPIDNFQTAYTSEGNTALELAGLTAQKVNECVEAVNGVDALAVQARQVVNEMQEAETEFINQNNDTRTQLISDNQTYIDGLTASKNTFDTQITADLATLKSNGDKALTDYEASIESSKAQYETDSNKALTDYEASLTASKTSFETSMNNNISTFQTGLNVSKETIENQMNTDLTDFKAELTTDKEAFVSQADTAITEMQQQATDIDNTVKQAVNDKLTVMGSDGTLSGIINEELLSDVNTKLSDIATFKASGNADTDTANLRALIASGRNITFENAVNKPFRFNETISFPVIQSDYGIQGRDINFNHAWIIFEAKNGVYPTNGFVFEGSAWPSNLRNTIIHDGQFDGKVLGAFIFMQTSAMWNCKVENVGTFPSAIAETLLEFNSNLTDKSNGGLNSLRNIMSTSNHTKYAVKFSVVSGADSQFDDFNFETIISMYTDGQDGATIFLAPNAYLVYSNFKTIYNGGNGGAICGNDANNYLIDCTLTNLYLETKSNTSVAVSVSMIRCITNKIHMKIDPTVTTVSYCVYQICRDCIFNELTITDNIGTELKRIYIDTITGDGNTFDHIGSMLDTPENYIRFDPTTTKNVIKGYYGDHFVRLEAGNLFAFSNAGNTKLMDISKNELLSSSKLHIKLVGCTNANTLNRFKIQLLGTTVNTDLMTFAKDTETTFDMDIDIIKTSDTKFAVFVKSNINGEMGYAHYGTPELTQFTIEDGLNININVTSASYILINELSQRKEVKTIKPVY